MQANLYHKNLLRKKGFDEGETCVYMEKTINKNE